MTTIQKIVTALAVIALLGGSFWYLINTVSAQAAEISSLETQQRQLKQDLKDSQESAKNARAQLEMWQWLYEDLQSGYTEIRKDREAMTAELRSLKEQQDVQDYLDCPMPDDLYDWVRQN